MKKLVLSLFNGMNCIGLALSKNKEDFQIYASEIDKYANKVSDCLFPNTVNLGDVVFVRRAICWKESTVNRALRSNYLSKSTKQKIRSLLFLRSLSFDLVVAGSPCQGFSFAGKQLNFNDSRSKLFFDFVKILEACKAKNKEVKFLLENVKMKGEYENVITKFMGIPPIEINSSLLSAQNRVRLYWTNIGIKKANLFGIEEPGIKQPKDKGILLKHVLELEVPEKYLLSEKALKFITAPIRIKKKYTAIGGEKALCLTAKGQSNWTGTFIKCGRQVGRKLIDGKRADNSDIKAKQQIELREDEKTNCLTTVQKDNLVILQKGHGFNIDNTIIRRLTPKECCRLQTIPEWAIEKILNCGVSDSQLYKMLGNGWTVDVIAYILSHLKK